MPAARSKNERVELEMKILRYRKLARQMATNPDTAQRIKELIADLEKELREIASKSRLTRLPWHAVMCRSIGAKRMGESAGARNAGTFGKLFQPVVAPLEAERK